MSYNSNAVQSESDKRKILDFFLAKIDTKIVLMWMLTLQEYIFKITLNYVNTWWLNKQLEENGPNVVVGTAR